ncbi:aldose epimerase family protein [Mucilaginibacter aquariorum]|uniref:Aldose 1-epimerase n=1 Tax=Mucilaginibacter aquariorum TaxID=2967225 RepID=A0ABT1T1R7_9SPHI|nr:galactose mutarotase [Mucilaginibacter aquariorum]
MSKISFGVWGVDDGRVIHLFKIENASGAYVELTNYGATLVSVNVPDRDGKIGNVILGYPSLSGYLNDTCYIGSTIGRFANRIANAKFELDGITYQLENNDGANSNHSGSSGFNYKVFGYIITGDELIFDILSEDGDGGFPGNLNLKVSYKWTEENELLITYYAVTDKTTVANFTNHSYFNLNPKAGNILNHELTIHADNILKAGADHIPTGLIAPAGNLAFDKQKVHNGINTCYVLNLQAEQAPACILSEETSGRVMTVFTTYPGVMLYTGDYLNSNTHGNNGKAHQPFDGLCLECQFFPDSPNHPHFPSTVLNPGETYQHNITYKFSTTV